MHINSIQRQGCVGHRPASIFYGASLGTCRAQRRPACSVSAASYGAGSVQPSSSAAAVGTIHREEAYIRGEPVAREGPLLVTFDNTQNAEDALIWTVNNLCYEDDRVAVVHVVCDPRGIQQATSVGVHGTGRAVAFDTVSNDADMQNYNERLVRDAEHAVSKRCSVLKERGIKYEMLLPKISQGRSAAVIAEAVLEAAAEQKARLMVVASHGPGALAEFGSVARFCCQHSPIPLLLVPPGVLQSGNQAPQDVVLVVNQVEELDGYWQWIADNLCAQGDKVHIWHVAPEPSVLPEWLEPALQQRGVHSVQYLHIQPPADATTVDAAGPKVVELSLDPNVKLVALLHDSQRGMIMEAMLGSLSSYMSRYSKKPLVLLPVQAHKDAN